MRLLRSFPLLTIVLVVLGMVGFSAAYGSVQLLFVGVTLAALSWYVTEGPRGRTLPRWVSNVLVLAVALAVIIDLLSPPNEVLQILGRFGVWLALIKLYERRTARDHGHLMGLSLLLMLIGCLRATSLLFGVVLLLYAVIGVYALLLYQLYWARERVAAGHRARPSAIDEPAPAVVRPTLGRHHSRHFRLLAAGIGGAGLLLSVFVFLIFPRGLGQGAFGAVSGLRRNSVTGYTDVVDLVTGGRITNSAREVAVLTLTDDAGAPVPLSGAPLLRGGVLDTYQAGRWTSSRGRRQRLLGRPSWWTPITSADETTTAPIQSYVFHDRTATVFCLAAPGFVRTAEPVELTFDAGLDTIEVARSDRPIARYAVRARATLDPAAGGDVVHGNRHGYLSAPSRSVHRVRGLARELLEAAGLPTEPPPGPAEWRWNVDAARVFAAHLRSSQFAYTLDLSDVVSSGDDPVAEFLFEHRRGHCEFFASALAALCHTVEIDARLVAGYRLSEGEAVVRVRASDAHAWVEVRSGEASYTPVDPTPSTALDAQPMLAASIVDRFGWLYRRIEGTWSRKVITFDDRQQARMLASLEGRWSSMLRRWSRSAVEWAAGINRAFYFGAAGYVWLGLVAFAIATALVAVIRWARRLYRLRRVLHVDRVPRIESRRFLRQLGFYMDMLQVLRASGAPKPAWQPPLDFARVLQTGDAPGAAEVRAITDLFYRARFGGHPLARDELRRANELVTTLAAARGTRRP